MMMPLDPWLLPTTFACERKNDNRPRARGTSARPAQRIRFAPTTPLALDQQPPEEPSDAALPAAWTSAARQQVASRVWRFDPLTFRDSEYHISRVEMSLSAGGDDDARRKNDDRHEDAPPQLFADAADGAAAARSRDLAPETRLRRTAARIALRRSLSYGERVR